MMNKEILKLMLSVVPVPLAVRSNAGEEFSAVEIVLQNGIFLWNVENLQGPDESGLVSVTYQDPERGDSRRRIVFHLSSVVSISAVG